MIPLPDTAVRRIGLMVIATTMALAAANIAISFSVDRMDSVIDMALLAIAFGSVTLLSVRSVPRNGAVWVLIWAAFFGVIGQLGESIGLARSGIATPEIEAGLVTVAPSEIDPLASLGLALGLSMWIPAVFLLVTLLLILFPSGTAVSPRWRWVTWVAALCMVGTALPSLLATAPWVDAPYDEIYASDMGAAGVFSLLMVPLMIIPAFALIGLVRRYRRSVGEERLQYRWVTWALAFQVLTIFGYGFLSGTAGSVVSTAVLTLIPVSFGIAITKYRLYDINIVISRTFVYGSLAAFIGAVYVVIVVGMGQLIGPGDEPNAGLAIVATVVVAVGFQPLRRRLERVANRLVYGRKATPYEVLSEFSRRVAATDDSLLDEAARSLVDGTAADSAVVWVNVRDRLVKAAEWPGNDGDESGDITSFPILQDGAELGVLTLEVPRKQRLPDQDRELATQVAAGMGLALRNQALTESLVVRVEELRESRRRLVAVQDETRRKLERDLHDGAQQQLVALKVKLGLARAIAQNDGATGTAAMLERLSSEADEAVDAMRSFARGVYPPLLEAEGLASAIASQARRAPIPITVEADGVGRYTRDVEATIYFCVLEALRNTTSYANASAADVVLAHTNGTVGFSVADDGDGFNYAKQRGTGITNMEDRVDATNGILTIDTAPGEGTIITGSIPARRLEEVSP